MSEINKEFNKLKHIKTPFNKAAFYFGNIVLKTLEDIYFKDDDEIHVNKIVLRNGKMKLTIYLLIPHQRLELSPLLFYVHGGAFVYKGSKEHILEARLLAKKLKIIVAYIDYRLAYNSPFEASRHDVFHAYTYLIEHAFDLNLDKDKFYMMGDSAGGYLILMALFDINIHEINIPQKVVLSYPVINPNPHEDFDDDNYLLWNKKNNYKMWKLYKKGRTIDNPLLIDYSFLKDVYLQCGQNDFLIQENKQFYELLLKEKVAVNFEIIKDAPHGFNQLFLESKISYEAFEKRIEFLKK